MRRLCTTALPALLLAGQALAGNYILTIDGKEHELDLGKGASIELANGQEVQVFLEKKLIVEFTTDNFSFSHPNNVTPSRTALGNGIHQTMMATPSGTLVMVQEYAGMNPSGLTDLMLNELLKEEKKYGYTITKSPASKTLADGKTVTGKVAVSEYRTDRYERFVLCYDAHDAGILILTQAESAAPAQDLKMIDLFWKSMRVTMN